MPLTWQPRALQAPHTPLTCTHMQKRLSANIPNIISVGRVIVVPVVVGLLMSIRPGVESLEEWNRTASTWAGVLFIIAAVSDMIDGYLARRNNIESIFGKLFDPLADKLLTFGALIMLIPIGRMTAWLVVVLLARELAVTTLRSIATGEGIVISASKLGKMKNAFSNSGISGLILYYPVAGVEVFHVGWLVFIISMFFAIFSGVQYGRNFVHAMRAN